MKGKTKQKFGMKVINGKNIAMNEKCEKANYPIFKFR